MKNRSCYGVYKNYVLKYYKLFLVFIGRVSILLSLSVKVRFVSSINSYVEVVNF